MVATTAIPVSRVNAKFKTVALGAAFAIVITVATAQAQSFQVLHYFSGAGDDDAPLAGLTLDGTGNFYGTTSGLGTESNGSVFRLTSSGSGWVLKPMNNFEQRGGGARPGDKVTIGPNGSLYGETPLGGRGDCVGDGSCGVVFKLQPPPNACASFSCPWSQHALYQFGPPPDAGVPLGGVVFDRSGNLYGATEYGGAASCANGNGCGAVYMLTPSGQGWAETVIYSFQGGNDGERPTGGLFIDAAGNLYGGTGAGGSNNTGIIYELSPSNGGWTETILHTFQQSDGGPYGALIPDQFGNLYGVEATGSVFELSPPGTWTYHAIFSGLNAPLGPLVFDSSGDLYGVAAGGLDNNGTIFKLTPSNGGWIATDLHDFQFVDGVYPNPGIVVDSAGNLFGTAFEGGMFTNVCYAVG